MRQRLPGKLETFINAKQDGYVHPWAEYYYPAPG